MRRLRYRFSQYTISTVPLLTLLVCSAWFVACNRAPESVGRSTSVKVSELPVSKSAQLTVDSDRSYHFQAPARIVAIGDLHGDLTATRNALRCAGAIDKTDKWVGANLVIVQTGDLLDRGDDERAMIDLFESIKQQARQANGQVHMLVGNHEIMNAQGDFRYVTPGAFNIFDTPKATANNSDSQQPLPNALQQKVMQLPAKQQPRGFALLAGGSYARVIGTYNTIIAVNDTLFAHGGVLPKHVRYGIGKINHQVKQWLTGQQDTAPALIQQNDAPVWTRKFSTDDTSPRDCRVLQQVLTQTGTKRLVVGHTPQKQGITSACDDKVWRIDVGLAKAYGSQPTQVLAIDGDKMTVLRDGNGCHHF